MGVSDLEILSEQRGNVKVLRVRGSVTFETETRFSHDVDGQVAEGARVLLDLRDTVHINSVGMGIIIRTFRRLQEKGGDLVVVCSRDSLLRAFRVLKFDTVLRLTESVPKGLALLRGQEGEGGEESPRE
jgi:anti-sigma B factor antagonist